MTTNGWQRWWMAVGVASVAIGAGVWIQLPLLLDALLALDAADYDHPGLQRLRIGHAMAGGGTAGTEFLAGAVKQTMVQKLTGSVTTTRSRSAWRDLATTLADAERRYLSPSWGFGLDSPTDPNFAAEEIAEGLLYVSHVTKLALEVYLQDSPRMVRMISPTQKLLGDNPNAQYYMASLHKDDDDVDATEDLIVKGCRTPNEVYLSYAVHVPSGGAFEKVVTDQNDLSMVFDDDGCYALYLSPTFPGRDVLKAFGNSETTTATWLETPREASALVSRHYFRTPPGGLPGAVSETVNVSIERASLAAETSNRRRHSRSDREEEEAPAAPVPVSDALMARRIARADDFVQRHTLRMPRPDPTTAPPFFSLAPNAMGRPQKWKRHAEGMGAVDIAYASGRFLLRKGEALVLEGAVPPCRFANVVVWNRFLQTLDYRRPEYPVSAVLDAPPLKDAAPAPFRIVLSQTKPKGYTGTWIYTEGRPTGTVFFRFILPENDNEDQYPKISTKVVLVDDLVVE